MKKNLTCDGVNKIVTRPAESILIKSITIKTYYYVSESINRNICSPYEALNDNVNEFCTTHLVPEISRTLN